MTDCLLKAILPAKQEYDFYPGIINPGQFPAQKKRLPNKTTFYNYFQYSGIIATVLLYPQPTFQACRQSYQIHYPHQSEGR